MIEIMIFTSDDSFLGIQLAFQLNLSLMCCVHLHFVLFVFAFFNVKCDPISVRSLNCVLMHRVNGAQIMARSNTKCRENLKALCATHENVCPHELTHC